MIRGRSFPISPIISSLPGINVGSKRQQRSQLCTQRSSKRIIDKDTASAVFDIED